MTNFYPLEEEEQITFVQWLELKGLRFTAIPNSTYTLSWNQKRKNKAMGLRRGLPDLIIVIPKKGLAFVEMKRVKGSTTNIEQTEWIKTLNELPATEAKICYGADEAIKFIEELLK